MIYGLIGKTLKHSYSQRIHRRLADYQYTLFEVGEAELPALLRRADAGGFNVTIPYKQTVMPFCDRLSPVAREIGSVNTLYYDREGQLVGDNTDAYGFRFMARMGGISFRGRKVLVLGSGGTSRTVRHVAREDGAREIITISRGGENNYSNLSLHRDAEIIVNTTPVGMYPANEDVSLDLSCFPVCRGVLDVIYNPQKTNLLLQAEVLGLPAVGGLSMLVAQAALAVERFTGKGISEEEIQTVLEELRRESCNIALIGMPGCGKTELGRRLAEVLKREFCDTDQMVAATDGRTAPEIFAQDGIPRFRELETCAVLAAAKRSGCVIATGGGTVLAEENRRALRQNSRIYFIERPISQLPVEGRPISQSHNLADLYRERLPIYRGLADGIIQNDSSVEAALAQILEDYR